MSTIRDPAIITAQGRQMMTAGGDISYTKAVLFGQDISHLTKEQLEGLTSIGNPLMTVTVGISDKSINNDGTTVSLEATFQNSGLKADLPYTAVGFFARKGDDTEKLVILGIANSGAYLAAASPDGVATDALDVKVAISIGDATSVTAVVDPAGSVTPAALNGAINKLDHDISAKIDANQDSTEKALDTKSDKATVESDLATKANQSDLDKTNAEVAKKADSENVTTQLDTKADKTDVASAVKQLQDSIATKADAKTVNDAISKIDFTPYAKSVDVYSKAELDKKLLALSTDTDGKVNADQVANMIEGKADKTDVNAKIKAVTDLANTKADASDVYTKKTVDDAFSTRDSNITNAANLAKQAQATANTKANSSDVYTKADVDGKTSGTIITAFDVASKTPTEEIGAYNHRRLVDQGVLGQFADAINAVNGTNRIANAVDVNTLTGEKGKVHVYLLPNSDNTNTPNWISDKRGNLIVINYDGNAKTQLWFPVGSGNDKSIGVRYWEGKNYLVWNRIAIQSDIDDLLIKISSAKNAATQANSNADSRLPLAGGSMNTNAQISFNDGTMGKLGGLTWNGSTDSAKIYGDVTANDNLDLAFDLGDDGSNHFSFRQNGSETSAITSDGHFTGTVDWSRVNGRPEVTPVINGSTGDDLFAYKTNQLRLYPGNGLNCKNLPPAINTQWFTVQYVFEAPNSDGIAIFRSPGTEVWINGNNGGSYGTWKRLADSGDITDLRNQIQQLRDNQFEVQTFTDATAAANWEAQKPGKRMAIVNK